ncbi:MAG: RnfABCDGE type electron transport complex subunit A [Dehalococcoidales bacterium]|nr:RnfABCDGE type electron transport complex subunit A [Dehalococcoidales bacterium]MDD5401818.1 RnfABCDGE type electron transport complex subunit A [Dehalococcoidales bacterium]
MTNPLTIFIGMALINNFVLVKFLGLCPFFGVSRKLSNALSMGLAVTFVMFAASAVIWPIHHFILVNLHAEYLSTVVYILVIATLVQIMELVIMRTNYALYSAFGIYLALITTNCAVLGVTLVNTSEGFNFIESLFSALGAGVGFALVLVIMSGIRERLDNSRVPRSMKGLPVAFLVAAFLGLAFSGFSGMI